MHSFVRTADPAGHARDIKISASALMNPSIGRLLKETSTRNLWVECQAQLFPGDSPALLQRLRALSEDYRCFPIVGDVPLLAAMVKDGSGIGRIALKGCEAAGFVSGETTLVLYSAAKEMLRVSAKSLDVLIWGGVSTPEAAAAFLSTGAAGIVFESVHWLTDLVVMDDGQRDQLARLRLDSTALVGLDLQVPCRLFNKGNSLAFKKIQAFEDSLCAAEAKKDCFLDSPVAREMGIKYPFIQGAMSSITDIPEFAAGHQDEQSFRKKMEEMTAGSLFAAVRGVDRRSGRPLEEQACMERGQFMSGSCAGLIGRVQKLESFHRELAEGPLLLYLLDDEQL